MLFAGECVLEQRTELALGKLVFLSILFVARLGTKTFSDLTVSSKLGDNYFPAFLAHTLHIPYNVKTMGGS